MPLLITPPTPLLTSAQVPLTTVYAIIDGVEYRRKGLTPKRIAAQVGYYYSETASTSAEQVQVPGLPNSFTQEASPEQANAVPIFDFLEGLLKVRLLAVLPEGTLIDFVD